MYVNKQKTKLSIQQSQNSNRQRFTKRKLTSMVKLDMLKIEK